jgi:hypothetical protein
LVRVVETARETRRLASSIQFAGIGMCVPLQEAEYREEVELLPLARARGEEAEWRSFGSNMS